MVTPTITSPDANSFYTQISAPQQIAPQTKTYAPAPDTKKEYPPSWFDQIINKTVNKRDLNDTVVVPRSIFKGYLGFTIASSLTILSGLMPNPKSKPLKALKTAITAAGAVVSAIATFHFVKPFLVTEKDEPKN